MHASHTRQSSDPTLRRRGSIYIVGSWTAIVVAVLAAAIAFGRTDARELDPPVGIVLALVVLPAGMVHLALLLELILDFRWKSLLLAPLAIWPPLLLAVVGIAPLALLAYRTYLVLCVIRRDTAPDELDPVDH